MIQIEFINPIKNAERVVNSVNGMTGEVILNIPSVEGLASKEYVERRVAEVQLGGEVDLTVYATKDYVDDMIAEMAENGILEPYATKEQVAADHYTKNEVYTKDEVEVKYKAYVQAELSEFEVPMPDLSDYYTKSETDAKITEVVNAIPEVDFTGYATEEYVRQAVEAIPQPDLTAYALKTDIPDVSGYQTAEQVQTAITEALGAIGVAEEGAY